ncbi:7268_t:CDS:2 [Funneliformis mosseae]|uniref:7268_t:CDS:1 n=1 Tax=Funneliformis mosseae TaxID=27381 RepID=A0A9N9C4G2_FUNMO|nr:7268_t:CDS:2 [Funneliformis mosseae]
MSVISGGSDDRNPFGISPVSVSSFPTNQDYVPSAINGGPPSTIASSAIANTILPPEQANINFKPTTTAISKISKLKLHVLLDSTIYTAGGLLTGRIVLTSSSARSLKLGEISVELTAYEELSVKEYTASQSFLSSRLVFQNENLPPSNAVHGPKENGYWTARKGKTTFPFAFKIPVDAPSSVEYGNLACLKYIVTGVVQFKNNNKEDTLLRSKEALVVEAWDGHNPIYKKPVDGVNMKQLWMGGTGAVTLEGTLAETLFQSGGNVSVQVRVKNETKRRVQGLKIAITHKLLILANKNKKEIDEVKIVGDTIAEAWFKNKDYLFDCGEDRSTTIHINVPKNAKTIRNTALFEVVCYIVISLYLGPFTYDLTVHLPVYIAHSASLQPAPIADADLNVFPNHYNMMDENVDFFVEDIRKEDGEVLGFVSTPVNIPSKNGDRVLPWSNAEDDGRGRYSPTKSSAGSYIFGSASPKKIGSFATSLLGRPKQMAPPNPSKLVAKSPPLAPASPYAYIPAIERVRYLSFTTQEQGAIQKRPFGAASGFGGYGKRSETQELSPPTSEYEFINTPPEPEQNVQKWLDNNDNQSERSSPAFSDGEPVATPGGKSPWAHINQSQEIAGTSPRSHSPLFRKNIPNGQGTTPIDIPIQNSDFSSDSFKRNDSLVSSPSGPSGLTLLMRKKSPIPTIHDNTFEVSSSISNGAYDHIPKGRPLPTPKPKEIEVTDEKSSELLQVPGFEQERPKTPPVNNFNTSAAATGGGNLSSLFKWGSSLIGYGASNDQSQLQSIEQNASNEIPKNRPRKQLPPPPTTPAAEANNNMTDNSSINPNPDENPVPKTRMRRSLPAVPTSVPQKTITTSSPIIEEEENPSNNISHSPPQNTFTSSVNNDPPTPSKPISTEKSDTPSAIPQKSSYFPAIPITKASIFAALGQKPFGMSSPPSSVPAPAPAPVVFPKKTLPVSPSTSPPKQKGFNVQRKPLELNTLAKDDPKIAEMIKNELKASENQNDDQNVSSNQVTYKLAIPPAVPTKKSAPTSVQVTTPVPISTKSDENVNTSMSSSPPIDPMKVLASPTTYINNTIAKPIVALTKITEPPKPVLSPRLQEYIKKYNYATGS